MFGSIKSFCRNKIITSQEKSLKQYIQSIQGMDDEEIAHLVLMATIIRNLGLKNSGINYLNPIMELEKNPYIILNIVTTIKQYQKTKQYAAAGYFTVWLHTFRSISEPELRIYGKKLWQELNRGIMFIEANTNHMDNYSSDLDNTTGYHQIPIGLKFS